MARTASPARLIAAVMVLGALAAGCTDSSPTASPPSTSTSLVVPSVSRPLEATAFRDRPCDLISPNQAETLGLPVAELDDSAGRTTCVWRPDDAGRNSLDTVSIRFQSESGLTTIAAQCGDCQSWTVDTIAGYPVLRANGPLESKHGMCRLFVGTADDTAFLVTDGDVGRSAAPEGPRCDRADRAAALAIETMGGAG